jgi:hypothetical protein
MNSRELLSVAKPDFTDISINPQPKSFTWFCRGSEVKIHSLQKIQ